MNKVMLIGRLVKDPELRFAQGTGTAIANFTVAVDRRFPSKDGQKEADFIPVVVFGKIAETVANYTSKGKLIGVSGRIQTRTYDAQDGSKRYVTKLFPMRFNSLNGEVDSKKETIIWANRKLHR